jgi:hypothetical protein
MRKIIFQRYHMSIENEENYNPDIPVSRQMTVIMWPYCQPGDARRGSIGWDKLQTMKEYLFNNLSLTDTGEQSVR